MKIVGLKRSYNRIISEKEFKNYYFGPGNWPKIYLVWGSSMINFDFWTPKVGLFDA